MLPPPRRGAPPRSAWTHQAERSHQRNKAGRAVFRLTPGWDEGRAGGRSGPPCTLDLQPPSPIFGAQPPHSPTLWGTFGPPSYLSFPPGAGGRTEQQRPPGHAARAWCRPAQVRSPSSRPRRPRLRAQGDTKPPPPSWPRPPKTCRARRRAGAQVRGHHVRPRRAAAPCTGPHRATPSRRPPEAGPFLPQGKPTQPTGFPGKARQNRSANLARLQNKRGVIGEIMPAFGGARSRFFFSRRQGGES